MANNLPVNRFSNVFPINATPVKTVDPMRARDEAIAVGLVSGGDVETISTSIEQGDTVPITEARATLDKESRPIEEVASAAFEEGVSPDEFVAAQTEDAEKKQEWYKAGDRFYLEQALSLNDPTVTAETMKFATNVQLGQELFETELSKMKEETGTAGYIGNFIDRYFLRAMPIGGFEQLTGRNTRKGQELLGAAATMSPEEYQTYIKNYIEELKDEGIFTGDNIFAIIDGMSEFQNKGYDSQDGLNRVLGALDVLPVVGAVVKGGKIAKDAAKISKVIRSDTPLKRVGALKGPEEAGEAAEKLVLSPEVRTPRPREAADAGPSFSTPNGDAPVHVPMNKTVEVINNNKIVQGIKKLNEVSFLGQGKTSQAVRLAADEAIDLFKTASNNPIVNVSNPLSFGPTGTPSVSFTLGKVKSGTPFKTESGANKLANKLKEDYPTARVTPVDNGDTSKGYYVQLDELLDTGKFAPEVQNKPAFALRQVYARIFGHKGATEDPNLHGAALRAESATSALQNLAKPFAKLVNKRPTSSQRTMSKIYADLRDGEDAYLRTAYSEQEFRTKWKEYDPKGLDPSQKDIEAFEALQTMNDASWLMKAHTRMQKYIAANYYGVDLGGGVRAAARRIETPSKEMIWNVSRKVNIHTDDLNPKQAVWELDRPLEGGVRLITEPENVSVLQHGDVLGYNAGGRRINPNANHFVVFGEDNPRAVITAFNNTEATTAVREIETVQKAIRDGVKGGKLDEVIQSNNTWNPEIETLADLNKWAKAKRVDLTSKLNIKARDGVLQTGETLDNFSSTWDEYVEHSMSRHDDVLTEFGGKEAMQRDPVAALFEDFSSITHQYAHNVYTNEALNAWVKAAQRKGSGWEWNGKVPSDPRRAFETAIESRGTRGNSVALELGAQRSLIKNRLNIKTNLMKSIDDYGSAMQSYVFDKTGLKIAKGPAGKAERGLLSLGFQSAFGFGNIAQFFVQSYHVAVIAAISPKHGLQGATLALPIRAALMAPDSASGALAVKRLAKVTGADLDEKGIEEILEYIHTSGRGILDGSMAELGTGSSYGLSGWKGESFLPSQIADITDGVKKAGSTALQVGLTPFKEGEILSRITAINTAALEWRAANKGASILTDEARRWISQREAALSFNMSNADRAMIQSGIGKIPTQWFTYSLRSLENIVIGRDFSRKERIRLAAALMPAFGTTGMGLSWANDYITSRLDYVASKVGAQEDSKAPDWMHTAVKRGIMDSLFEGMTGEEIDLASRLAPITLFQDVYRNVEGQKTPFEMATGPSGDIAAKMTDSVISIGAEIIHGNSVAVTNDTIRAMRNFSGIDNIAKAHGIMQNKLYRSRTGVELPFEMDTGDAIMALMGFSPRELSDWYKEKQFAFNHDKSVQEFTKEMQTDWVTAMHTLDKDPQAAYSLMKTINEKITLSGFSFSDQRKVQRGLKVTMSETLYRMIYDAYQRGDTYHAEQLEDSFNFIGAGE